RRTRGRAGLCQWKASALESRVVVLGERLQLLVGERIAAERFRLGRRPVPGFGLARVLLRDAFKPPANDFGEAHLVVGRDSLGRRVEVVGYLYLRLYHDDLPSWRIGDSGQAESWSRRHCASAKSNCR